MITFSHKTSKDRESKLLPEFKKGAWIEVEDPSEDEIARLISEFKIDETLIQDALDPFEVPRLEKEDGLVYVYTRVPNKLEDGRLVTWPLLVVIGPRFIATIHRKKFQFLQKFIQGKGEFNTTKPTQFLSQMFDSINTLYQNHMNAINKSVRGTGFQIERIENKHIVQFVRFEEILNDFLSALTSSNTVLGTLLKGKVVKFFEDDHDLIEDVQIANTQLIESGRANLKSIQNIREAYSTIMSQDLNRVIKLLTVLTILLNVPVLVASLYGMNVPVPGSNSPYTFYWIIGSTALLSVFLYMLFIYNKWLK